MKFSTCTLCEDEIVPWLASSGELAYTPHLPPADDRFFEYSWVLPDIFDEHVNLQHPLWFAAGWRGASEAERLLAFWNEARRGKADEVFTAYGCIRTEELSAPIAVYRHAMYSWRDEQAILIQHGSYQFVEPASQPLLSTGEVLLYRGIGERSVYKFKRLGYEENRLQLMQLHADSLHDSVRSFHSVHAGVCKTQTDHLNPHEPFPTPLRIPERPPFLEWLAQSSYTLNERIAAGKFGPHYVKFRTSVTNIRITTFFCGEAEVQVIDPEKLEVIEAVGCKLKDVWLDDECDDIN